MLTVNIHEAKTNLSRLVEEAAAGQEVIIAKAGKPIARLVPFGRPPTKRRLGRFKGQLNVPDDFDAPLALDIAQALVAGDDEAGLRRKRAAEYMDIIGIGDQRRIDFG